MHANSRMKLTGISIRVVERRAVSPIKQTAGWAVSCGCNIPL